jgi:hypothetical protein
MPRTSSSRGTCRGKSRTASCNVAAGIEQATVAILSMLLATSALSITLAPASQAEPPSPPLPLFESEPPAGLIVGVIVDEPAAAEIQLTTADLIMVQADEKASSERDKQEQRDRQQQKDRDAAKNACGEQSKDCKEALKNLRDDGIETIALDIRVGGRPGSDYPCECRLEGETFQPRRFATTMMTWKAAGNCHKPLYFEDWNLERYGHSHGPLDPVFSAAHFFVTLPVLPYKMGVELPWECVYPLGYYRPGSCAPWTVPAPPISCRGFAVEAATVTGLLFLLP